MKKVTIFFLMLFTLIFIGCTSPNPSLNIGETAAIEGAIVDTIDDCAFDGICAVIVETDQGRITVNWAEGDVPCLGQMDSSLPSEVAIEAFGQVLAEDTITICSDASYYLRVKP